MKILLLSNLPYSFQSYDRDLRSKVHKEIKKYSDVVHVLYLFKGEKIKFRNILNTVLIEIPLAWNYFYQKICGIIFILFNNIKLIKKTECDLIRLELGSNGIYDLFMFLYPIIFPKRIFYVETSTPSVSRNKFVRLLTNFLLRTILKTYDHIGVASENTRDTLKIPLNKCYLHSLGYPEYAYSVKEFKDLRLFYLGTLNNRDIHKTIIGFNIFTSKYPNLNITYEIIGGGNEKYLSKFISTLQKHNSRELIHYHGFQSVEFVNNLIVKCNVGVAFVPIVEYYDKVSTTKAIEYLLAGMPVIATETTFAKTFIKPEAGVLCKDTPEDFARAIENIYLNRNKFNSDKIRKLYEKYSMSYIIKNEYLPKLVSIINNS